MIHTVRIRHDVCTSDASSPLLPYPYNFGKTIINVLVKVPLFVVSYSISIPFDYFLR